MPTKLDSAQQTRAKLLAAATEVIRAQGTQHLTLDTVAKTAGISKGGLLHHFASKNALMQALLEQFLNRFQHFIDQYYQQEPLAPGRWLRAYIRATFADEPADLETGWLLLISLAEEPAFITQVQAIYRQFDALALQDGLPAARATIIRFAADAYWINSWLNGIPNETMRSALLDELLRLTHL